MLKTGLLTFGILMSFAGNAAEVSLPEAIQVAEGYAKFLTVHATGDQIYHCVFKEGSHFWKWHAPDAKLYDQTTRAVVGSHGKGPHWQYKDGSGVKAKLVQKTDAPDKAATQWLLLEATGHNGKGLLTETAYIQRINTQGGLPPVKPCDSNHLGSEERVPYSADYVFYK